MCLLGTRSRGRCAGEVASSAGYAPLGEVGIHAPSHSESCLCDVYLSIHCWPPSSTAGLYVASAGGYDCPAAVTPKQKKDSGTEPDLDLVFSLWSSQAAFKASKNPWTYKRLTKQCLGRDRPPRKNTMEQPCFRQSSGNSPKPSLH